MSVIYLWLKTEKNLWNLVFGLYRGVTKFR